MSSALGMTDLHRGESADLVRAVLTLSGCDQAQIAGADVRCLLARGAMPIGVCAYGAWGYKQV